MDDGSADNTLTKLESELSYFFYPTLGILRDLLHTRFSEEDAEKIVTAMWGFAPEEMRRKLCKMVEQSLAA